VASDPESRARALGDAAEAIELYRTWAATYDDDVFVRGGFTGTARIAELLVTHLRLAEPGGLIAWVIAAAVWPTFAPVLDGLRVRRLHESLEPIRFDGPLEGVMFVGRTPGPTDP
jgi:hypothetical protein